MKKWWLFLCILAVFSAVNASWYWPFGPDEDKVPRLSTLMRDATRMIDEATELAADNKGKEAIAKYREALAELAQIEANNPERANTPEFTSLRNKRAYVCAAIDSLLLSEARENAKAVAITDTTELEKMFLRKKGLLKEPAPEAQPVPAVEPAVKTVVRKSQLKAKKSPAVRVDKQNKRSSIARIEEALRKDPNSRKYRLALIGEHIRLGEYDRAKQEIEVLLKANMTDSSALNLKAICEASQGDPKAAEETLFMSIKSNPHDFNGYYNMANLKLYNFGNIDAARLYYDTGRKMGGPKDEALEEALK